MIRSLKTHFFTLLLLTTSSHLIRSDFSNEPSFRQIIADWWYGKQQTQSTNPDEAPAFVTVEHYIAQFRSDLNGHDINQSPVIPWDEIQELELTIKEQLQSTDLKNRDLIDQKILSIVINHVKTKTISDLNNLRKEGFSISSSDYESISNSVEQNVIARLGRMPHLNGQALAQFFGENRKQTTKNEVISLNRNRRR